MLLHCTLVAAPGAAGAAGSADPVELCVEVPAGCAGEVLESALARRLGSGRLTVRGVPVAGLTAGVPPLVNGAVLVDGCPGTGPGASRAALSVALRPPLLLAVHSGPGAGLVAELRRGGHRIGRGGMEIDIPDPALSREHARLDVSDSAISIVDLGSSNGTFVDGRSVGASPLTTGSVIRCGSSTMRLHVVTPPPFTVGGGAESAGTESAGPESAGAGTNDAEPLVIRSEMSRTGGAGRTTMIVTGVVPLVAGVALVLATGMWLFLAFTAVSTLGTLLLAVAGARQRRRFRAALAAALRQDADRRHRAAPSPAVLVLRAAAGHQEGHPEDKPGAPIGPRLGLARLPANVLLDPPDPGFHPPTLDQVPLLLGASAAHTAVHGPRPELDGLIRSVIMQHAGRPAAHRPQLLIHGQPGMLPLAARFLPGVTLSGDTDTTREVLTSRGGPEAGGRWLIILDDAGPGPATGPAGRAGTAAGLSQSAAAQGWRVIRCGPLPYGPADAAVALGNGLGRLVTGTAVTDFAPDLVSARVFDRYCRQAAAGRQPREHVTGTVPDRCDLADVVPHTAGDLTVNWARHARGPGLSVAVGVGAGGALEIDLHRDGPHLLVAGTTGSGKSEFLRTLAAGLAAKYPPDRLTLLFIDFKGGSGLAPLSGLPHCVGMLTDLGLLEVERALASLRAEVRRRERLLGAAGVLDLSGYELLPAAGERLPRLLIIVDEFRMLVHESPAALSELMRIAMIGRSLGLHLVLATQRPHGAVTADIRANITTCVALRVQSRSESMDIMDSPLAASIPLSLPGRAYLVRGSEEPVQFQTATLQPGNLRDPAGVVVRTAADFYAGPGVRGRQTADDGDGPAAPTQCTPALVSAASALWPALGGSPPRPPVAPPLPARLTCPAEGDAGPVEGGDAGPGTARAAETLRLGAVDRPELQCLTALEWSPAGHGHLGLITGSAGAGNTALRLVLDQLLRGAVEYHVYVLDADGSSGACPAAPRLGAMAGPGELRRAVRVVQRLAEEVTVRLGAPAGAEPRPPIVLVLHGWGAWVSALRAGPLSWAEDLVLDIVRDGSAAGVTVVVSGGRELVTARFFDAVPNRIYLPAGSNEDSRRTWPRLPSLEPVPGRAAVFGSFLEPSSPHGFVAQLLEPGEASPDRQPPPAVRRRPFRIDALPVRITPEAVLGRGGTRGHDLGSLCVGVGGDELRRFFLALPAGGVLAVLGGSGSGKTTLLAALPALNPQVAAWQRPGSRDDPAGFWTHVHRRAVAGELDRAAILLADDAELQTQETNSRLLELNNLGWRVVITAGFGPGPYQRVPLLSVARSQGTGIIICPRTPLDGDLFGVRLDPEAHPPPGRALAIAGGTATAVQLAAVR